MSNSSKELRENLKKLAIGSIPPILNTNRIDDYYNYTNEAYIRARKQFQDNNYEQSYVNYYTVAHLLTKAIPNHNGYNIIQNQKGKLWGRKIAVESMEQIEIISKILDNITDNKTKINLINEFDDLNGDYDNDETPVYLQPYNRYVFNNDTDNFLHIFNINNKQSSTIENNINVEDNNKIEVLKPDVAIVDKSKYFNLLKPKEIVIQQVEPSQQDLQNNTSVNLSNSINQINESIGNISVSVNNDIVPSNEIVTSNNSNGLQLEENITQPPILNSTSEELVNQQQKPLRRFAVYLSEDIKKVLKYIPNPQQLNEPSPSSTRINITVGQSFFMFCQDDYHVSFLNFLRFLPAQLQNLPIVLETNRCFFIHLGVATSIHPFILQTVFRIQTSNIIQNEPPDSLITEILQSILQPAAFIDFNSLLFLWPKEFSNTRLCLISGKLDSPIISTFQPKDIDEKKSREIILRCDGSHFTLLRPYLNKSEALSKTGILPRLFATARAVNIPIHEHFVQDDNYSYSINETYKIAKSQL